MQMAQMGFMAIEESHCPSDDSYGMLEQMAIYMSVNQLNEAIYEEDTEIGKLQWQVLHITCIIYRHKV